ncbi:Ribosomal large subunit pseudouridine synthase C [Klebsiella pneumoniae IS39]|nr:Ribosomal large subunit pseudouridine synthase C [Klebsiella pneumoniae IS39]
MSGANASGYLESRTMKTETPTVKMVAIAADEAGQRIDNFFAYAIERRTEEHDLSHPA